VSAPPIVVRGLERRFGERIALDGIDLEVGRGEIVGLVGPNGSGKTTLLRLVAGFLRPHAGSVRVFGEAPFESQALVMQRARFAFAPPALFERLTAREHLRYLSAIRHPSMPHASPRDLDEVLERVGLRERAEEPVGAFSFGMRQRLILAQALLPLPELIVLDEPTDGLDPLAVLELRKILERLRDEVGLAVLLSSHLLIEIEELVDHMLVLIEGRAVHRGSPESMVAGRRSLRLRVDEGGRGVQLLRERGFEVAEVSGELELPAGSLTLGEAAELFRSGGLELRSFREHVPSLEEALLERLGRGLDEQCEGEARA